MRRAAPAALAVALLVLVTAAPGRADAPVKAGWWSETNAGLGVSAVPAQVPSGGLYVENGFSGPVAMSALSFDVPAGATVGQMTLQMTGNPVITSPPVACALTPAGQGFKAADGGAWSDRPAYDCSQGQVTATVASDKSSVSFAVGPLLHNGVVAVAVLAGGPADQIVFKAPGTDTLAVTAAGSATAPAPAPPSGAAPAPTTPPPAVSGSAEAPAAAASGGSEVAAAPSTPIPGPAGVSIGSGPSLAIPALGAGSAGTRSPSTPPAPPGTAHRQLASAVSRSSGAGRTGEILGSIGLVGLLVAYTEGYGLLGGRIRPLARLQPSRKRPAYPAK